MRFVFLVACLVLAPPVLAGNNGVLLENVQQVENKPAVIGAIKKAFIGRRGTIVADDANSVTASIARKATTSRMTITISGRSLMYEETSFRLAQPHGPTPTAPVIRDEVKLDGWLENIRRDVMANVAAIPLQSAQDVTVRTISERLKVLDELRRSGVITEDEYAKKRAEILSSL